MSAYPFSAVPGIAMTESPISSNPPTNEISVGYSKVSSQYSLPSSTRSAKESSPYFFNNTWDRLPPPCQNSQDRTPSRGTRKSSVIDLHPGSLFIKADCENDGAGGLEILLEQSLDR